MNVGDLVRIRTVFTAHGTYEENETKVAMIVEGPNEAGKVKLLLPTGTIVWRHTAELEYIPRNRKYLHE
jgi:hypothetical protein